MHTQPHEFKVLIYEHELDHIAGWVLEHPDRETGGELCGFWTNARSPSVQFVIGPGPDARHGVAAFYQDGRHQHDALRTVREGHGLQHVGEWHSHHRLGLTEPSSGDARTIQNVFERYPIDEFLLCIATIGSGPTDRGFDARQGKVSIGAFLFKRGLQGYLRGGWVVLPGASPIAESMRRSTSVQGATRPLSCWQVPRVNLETPASLVLVPEAGWYTQEHGADLLRKFDALCRNKFQDCEMVLDEGGVLEYGFVAVNQTWCLRFPRLFPAEPVQMRKIGDEAIVSPSCKRNLSGEREGSALFDSVLAAIGQVFEQGPSPSAAAAVGHDLGENPAA